MSDRVSLLPENATALELGVEAVTGRVAEIDPTFAWLWNPDEIPEALLPYLAWALSVDVWESAWPEAARRRAIRDAIAIHRAKGTRGAVARAVASVGARARITEWWQATPKATPHTFTITALAAEQFNADDAPILDARLLARVTEAVTAAKPVREHFTLEIGASFQVPVGAAARSQALATTRRRAHVDCPRPKRRVALGAALRAQSLAVIRHTSELGAAP